MIQGSLTIVGIGIKLVSHITVEAKANIEQADKVFHLVTGDIADEWIETLNPHAESLRPLYVPGKLRLDTYQEMVAQILTAVRQGLRVCAVFYGHPGVFVLPAHEAIRQARAEGYKASMLPGISAEDCLFADLGIDPASCGCQSFEATDFLVYQRRFDPHSHLILWQVGLVGELHKRDGLQKTPLRSRLQILAATLMKTYPPYHQVTIYEAAQLPIQNPRIETIALVQLPETALTAISTLYIAPVAMAVLDTKLLAQLGIDPGDLQVQNRIDR